MTKVIELTERRPINTLISFEHSYTINNCIEKEVSITKESVICNDTEVLKKYYKLYRKNFSKARKMLEDYASRNNAGPDVYRELGYLYTYLSDDDKVIGYFEKVLKDIPNDQRSLYELKEYFYRQCMINREYSKNAEKYLNKYLNMDMTDAKTYFQIYKILENKYPEKSIRNLNLARKFAYLNVDKNIRIINEIDISLADVFYKNEQYDKVIEVINCIHKREFKNFGTCYVLGQSYNALKDFKKAEKYYKEALRLKGNISVEIIELILDIAYLYSDIKKHYSAVKYFKIALNLCPEDLDYCRQQIMQEINYAKNQIAINKKISRKKASLRVVYKTHK